MEAQEKLGLGKATAFATRLKQGTAGDFFYLNGERYDIGSTMRARLEVLIFCFFRELGAISRDELLQRYKNTKTPLWHTLKTTRLYIHFLKKH